MSFSPSTASTEAPAQNAVASAPLKRRGPSRAQQLNKLYSMPAPLRTFPLPTLVPHNPLSLFYVLYTWISQTWNPPSSHPETLYHGYFSPETRSIHVTDPRSARALWEQGFYGKGNLSRSEPSWLDREKRRRGDAATQTSEEVTRARRAERQQVKWERARKEREAIDQTLCEERKQTEESVEQRDVPETTSIRDNAIEMSSAAIESITPAMDAVVSELEQILSTDQTTATKEQPVPTASTPSENVASESQQPAAQNDATVEEIAAVNEVEPATAEPTLEKSVIDEPVVQESIIEELAAEESTVQEPVTEEPAVQDSASEELAAEESAIQEPIIEKLVAEESAVQDSIIEELAAEDSTVQELATEEPAIQDSVTEELAAEESTIEDLTTESALEEAATIGEHVDAPAHELIEEPQGTNTTQDVLESAENSEVTPPEPVIDVAQVPKENDVSEEIPQVKPEHEVEQHVEPEPQSDQPLEPQSEQEPTPELETEPRLQPEEEPIQEAKPGLEQEVEQQEVEQQEVEQQVEQQIEQEQEPEQEPEQELEPESVSGEPSIVDEPEPEMTDVDPLTASAVLSHEPDCEVAADVEPESEYVVETPLPEVSLEETPEAPILLEEEGSHTYKLNSTPVAFTEVNETNVPVHMFEVDSTPAPITEVNETVVSATAPVEETQAPSPLTKLFMSACEKRGCPITPVYADQVLREHDNKLVPAVLTVTRTYDPVLMNPTPVIESPSVEPEAGNSVEEDIYSAPASPVTAPIGPLELLALPNSLSDIVEDEWATGSLHLRGGGDEELSSDDITEASEELKAIAVDVHAAEPETVVPSSPKSPKTVRFSPNIDQTTYIKDTPPSLELAASISDKIDNVPSESESDAALVDKEHLQLTLEETFFLAYGLGVLTVYDPESKKPMGIAELFDACRAASYYPPLEQPISGPDDPFLVNYVVYHHFRSLGWTVRGGTKFSVDFLLYNRGPPFSHAEFAVVVVPSYSDPYWTESEGLRAIVAEKEKRTWHWLHCINRVNSQVKKTVVLVYVDIPPPAPEPVEDAMGIDNMLKRYKLREVVLKRWLSNRSRD